MVYDYSQLTAPIALIQQICNVNWSIGSFVAIWCKVVRLSFFILHFFFFLKKNLGRKQVFVANQSTDLTLPCQCLFFLPLFRCHHLLLWKTLLILKSRSQEKRMCVYSMCLCVCV